MSSNVQVQKINPKLRRWVDDVAELTQPAKIVWCNGSEEEYNSFVKAMVADGTLIPLNQEKYPNCYLHRSNPKDIARSEKDTYICSLRKEDAGQNNNWIHPQEAKKTLNELFNGCMKNKTMYVIPYLLGPLGSPYSQVGVEVTDSLYVTVSMRIMTNMGAEALQQMTASDSFVKGIHSSGQLDGSKRYICHFPEEKLIMSINSNYGGNALLSKKCHSLRLASIMARDEGWLAEHMLVIGIKAPDGNVTYVTGAFPSASGKTNLAMLKPPANIPGWNVDVVSDDIAWMHLDTDGRLHAINPEAGFFGVAPNSSIKTNPNVMQAIRRNTLFTNVALTKENTPWWEGLGSPPSGLIDWQGRKWSQSNGPAAHPNSRFTSGIKQYPFTSPRFSDPQGVPISALIFGGRRADLMPLVCETFSWEHGVLMAAMMKVETTAALEGQVGVLRYDPMAMKPFCGYDIGDYFAHWLSFGTKSQRLPKIFMLNAFRKTEDGSFLWPGYSQNLRVLKWIVGRCNSTVGATKTPIGYVPSIDMLDLTGLDLPHSTLNSLFDVNKEQWIKELEVSREFFKSLGDRFPQRLWKELSDLETRLAA